MGVARRGTFVLFVLAVSLVVPLFPAHGDTGPQRLILSPSSGTTFRVQAVYPNTGVTCDAKRLKDLRARYRGRLQIVRRSNGLLALIDEVTFDEYLQGLSEMPRSWPLAALQAQVVAARTYAIYELTHPRASGRSLGYDICSTDQCQVYRGVSVEQGAFGEAWVNAVRSTRGKIMRYHGRPISAFYFSTSSGRTRRNFPGGSPLPYIRSVPGQDGASPLAHWTVKVPLADIGPILQASNDWPGGAVSSVALSGDAVTVSGSGHTAHITKGSFRFDLNDQAACVFPTRYPTVASSGSKLPQTVPSIDFSLARSGSSIVMTGRGWGHDVGMSQYGAKSLAENGKAYADILAYYYAGIRPQTVKEPGLIRVLIADGVSLARVAVEGSATAATETGSTLAPGERFEVRGGKALDIRRGIGPTASPVLMVTLGSAGPFTSPAGGTIPIAYTLSGPARVTLSVQQLGAEVYRSPEVSQTTGPNTYSLVLAARASPAATPTSTAPTAVATMPSVAAAPLKAGDYQVIVEAFDGLDRVKTAPVAMSVQPAAARKPLPARRAKSSPLLWIVIGAALLAGAAFMIRKTLRAGR